MHSCECMWVCLQTSSIIYGFIYKYNHDKCILIIIIIIKFYILTKKKKEKKSYYVLNFSMHCMGYQLVLIIMDNRYGI